MITKNCDTLALTCLLNIWSLYLIQLNIFWKKDLLSALCVSYGICSFLESVAECQRNSKQQTVPCSDKGALRMEYPHIAVTCWQKYWVKGSVHSASGHFRGIAGQNHQPYNSNPKNVWPFTSSSQSRRNHKRCKFKIS